MKIAVIGGAGYIGSHIVKELKKFKYNPIVFDNLDTGLKENIKNVEFMKGDILNRKDLEKFFKKHKFGGVIHLASLKAAGESMQEPERYSENNISGTINLLNTIIKYGVKYFIFSSSAAVYGIPKYLPLDEKHSTIPINYYGFTKLMIENILSWYSKLKDIRYVSLRYFNVVGYDIGNEIKGKEKNPQNLFPIMMEVANKTRESLEIFGNDYKTKDGTCIRDYIHVTDLARAHVQSLGYLIKNNKNAIINLGTGKGLSINECINESKKIVGDFKTIKSPRRPGDPPILYTNNSIAKEILNWTPRHSDMKTIVKTMWKVYKKKN